MTRPERVNARLKLHHLRVMLAVSETGSMAKAAKQLATSQSVVSKAIAELEAMLGVRVFDRSAQGVDTTLYGKSVLRRAIAVFDELQSGFGEIAFLANPGVGELRIGSTMAQQPVVVAVIETLSRQYPRLKFKVTMADRAILLDRELRGRHIDLMIAPDKTGPGEEDVETTFLYDNVPVVLAGMKSRWTAKAGKLTLGQLIEEPWCLPPPETALGAAFLEGVRASGLPLPHTVVWSASNYLCHRLLEDGRFLGVGTNVDFNSGYRGALKVLPLKIPAPPFTIAILTLKNRTISPIAHLFIDCACEIVRPWVKCVKSERNRST